jgi:hypothetical protein
MLPRVDGDVSIESPGGVQVFDRASNLKPAHPFSTDRPASVDARISNRSWGPSALEAVDVDDGASRLHLLLSAFDER